MQVINNFYGVNVENNKERWYTLPRDEFEQLRNNSSSSMEICKEFIKSQTDKVEINNWENSPIPFALKLYNSLEQFLTFLEQKLIEEPPKRIKDSLELH